MRGVAPHMWRGRRGRRGGGGGWGAPAAENWGELGKRPLLPAAGASALGGQTDGEGRENNLSPHPNAKAAPRSFFLRSPGCVSAGASATQPHFRRTLNPLH